MKDVPDKKGLTSLEAAALILSDGQTTDPNKAVSMSQGVDLNMDGLQRAHLRRMMGFDFEMQQLPNVILVTSKEKPLVRSRCKVLKGETDEYGNVISDDLINRLVEACLDLKLKYDAEKERLKA